MKPSKLAAIFVAVLSVLGFAGPGAAADDPTTIKSLVREIRSLHQAGTALRKKYDFNDLNQLRACVAENGHLRDKAKGLRQIATGLNDYSNRLELTLAADYAFTCVYCGGKGEDCAKIPPALKKVESSLSP